MNNHTIYQKTFLALRETGLSVSESALEVLHKFLAGKTAEKSKKKPNRIDLNAELWESAFWSDVSSEVFETESFSLALARYLGQRLYTHDGLVQKIFRCSPNSLREAIKYSQVFLFRDHPRWQEIRMLNTFNHASFSSFLDACQLLAEERDSLKLQIKSLERPFANLSPLEILIYASLFAFKYLKVQGQGMYDPDNGQLQAEALNQILHWKLGHSIPEDFLLTVDSLGESLAKNMVPLLFPNEPVDVNSSRCENLFDAFENLLSAYLEFNCFERDFLDWFCFDKDFSFHFEGKQLVEDPVRTKTYRHWCDNGKKLKVFYIYWFSRANKDLFLSGLMEEKFGLPENNDSNQLAYTKALGTMLQLWEVYGFDTEITVASEEKTNLFKLLHSLELMSVFYRDDFFLPFEENYKITGNWQQALAKLMIDGLTKGENRFPITFAEEEVKVAKIQAWTVSAANPLGCKKTARIILNFWTNDLGAMAEDLRQKNKIHAPFSTLYERPILKAGRYLFTLPWLMFKQNNATAAINNLRRLGNNRKERLKETHRIEIRLAEMFAYKGFQVIYNYEPSKDFQPYSGEIDLICARDGHLFIFEIKSGYIRRTLQEAWRHKTETLRKAGLQLTRKKKAVIHELEKNSPLLQKLGLQKNLSEDQIHCWILDTSIEYDHEYFSGFLKVSIEELIIALRDECHLLRIKEPFYPDNEEFFSETTDLENVYDKVIGKQASDTLYPEAFSAKRFGWVIESGLVWKAL